MIDYAIYDNLGRVLRTGSCDEASLQYQAQTAESLLEGKINQTTQYVVNGAIVDLPVMPSGECYFYNYSTNKWAQDTVLLAQKIRAKRDSLMAASDFYDTVSAQQRLTAEMFQAWATYRQALRDLPSQSGFPMTVSWPAQPVTTPAA